MRLRKLFLMTALSILTLVFILPITLAEQERSAIIGTDAQAKELLKKIELNPQDACAISDFAAYAAKKAWFDEAIEYYEMALKIKKDDHILWTNVGSVYVRMGKDSSAIAAFKKAIDIEPLHAIAHYNLGAIYDSHHKYEPAIREYKIALTLDPALANPAVNPLIVNNTLMTVLNMMLYEEKEGALSLPLQPICD